MCFAVERLDWSPSTALPSPFLPCRAHSGWTEPLKLPYGLSARGGGARLFTGLPAEDVAMKSLPLVLAAVVALAIAQTADAAEEGKIGVEFNNLQNADEGCRAVFVLSNGLGKPIPYDVSMPRPARC